MLFRSQISDYSAQQTHHLPKVRHVYSINYLVRNRCEIIRDGMKKYLTPMGRTPLHVNPIFEIGPKEPRFSEWLVFEGISVDESGRQHYLDASVAYKRVVLNAIDYLSRFGYTKEQVRNLSLLTILSPNARAFEI